MGGDAGSIDAQNRAVLAGMSPAEVGGALEEVESRLTPAMLAFLRARGAAKAQGSAGPGACVGTGPAGQAPPTSCSTSTTTQAGAGAGVGMGVGVAAAAAPGAHAVPPPARIHNEAAGAQRQPQQQRQQGDEEGQGRWPSIKPPRKPSHTHGSGQVQAQAQAQGGDAGAVEEGVDDGRLVADPRLVARIRWGLDAVAVGVQAEGEVQFPEDVMKRDGLRTVSGRSGRLGGGGEERGGGR